MTTSVPPRFLALVLLLSSFCIAIGFQNSRSRVSLASFASHSRFNRDAPILPIDKLITTVEDLPMSQPSRQDFFQSSQSSAAASILGSVASLSLANAASLTTLEPYTDSDYSFRLSVPSSWKKSTQHCLDDERPSFSQPVLTMRLHPWTP
jgi:hypothetical protein